MTIPSQSTAGHERRGVATNAAVHSVTLSVCVRDCARLRRMAYVRAEPLVLDELTPLFVRAPTVHRFSAYLEHADDAWTAELIGGARATGTVGGRSLLVTYGKLGFVASDAQDPIESWLEALWGPLRPMDSLLEADRWLRHHRSA
ncbi:MAG: hypothetical protein AAF211_04250 [Myxococcota bacterium]